MGRPRLHDEQTREALLAAAETLVEEGGPSALSVRAVADSIGTTTRAVYSTFGSKEGLLNALARRSFELLRDDIARLPATDDPLHDLVTAAVKVFRPMAVEHPAMFALAFLRAAPDVEPDDETRAVAGEGLDLLRARIRRLADEGRLNRRDLELTMTAFNALCQGLATTELRNPEFFGKNPERAWRRAFEALLTGLMT